MAELELLRGYRSLEHVDWIGGVEDGGRQIFGEGALDFHDEAVQDRELILFDEWELAEIYRNAPSVAGRLATRDLLSAAWAKMPPEFRHVAGVRELKRPKVSYIQALEGRKRVIIAPVTPARKFKQERNPLTAAIDEEAGVKLSWRDRVIGVRLAAVATDDYIENDQLTELAHHMPRDVYVGGGHLEKVPVEA